MIGSSSVPMLISISAGRVRIAAARVLISTPLTGTRLALRVAQCRAPGTAPSRLNAKSMRDVDVRQAVEQ